MPNLHVIDVTSALEMRDAAVQAFPEANLAILCAAVADYRPANPSPTKIKRNGQQDNCQLSTINCQLVENPDIAATLGGMKRQDQTLVGFALETNDEETNAQHKLQHKHLDMIVLNSLRQEGAAFGCDTNVVTIFRKDGERLDLPKMPKTDVARHILDLL
jgi:phosphopantothenoylcysteine decarboxylase/phosphopantothenate--cysteine ligase